MKNGSIKGLKEFMELASEHEVSFSIEVDHGPGVGRFSASVGYPRQMKTKLRDAMRDWAADNKMKLLAHLLTIITDGKPEPTMTPFEQAVVEALKASAEKVDKPITPLT
jgi:hypothetical protein